MKVLYEDDQLLVIRKDYGKVVNRAESVVGMTLQDEVERTYPKLFSDITDSVFINRSGMVHRLDKDTSGVMLWSKTPEMMHALMRLFKERKVYKTYLALVYGFFEPSEGSVRLPMARHPFERRRFSVQPMGKMAVTQYRRIAVGNYDDMTFSLMKLKPVTGRTHQLRVHMSYVHAPLVGDPIYAGRRMLLRSSVLCDRLFLHAKQIQFRHPNSGRTLCFESPLDDDLQQTLHSIGLREGDV